MDSKNIRSLIKRGVMVSLLVLTAYGVFCCCSATDPDDPALIKEDPSFSQDIQPIFDVGCALSGCHNSTASAGLDLSSGRSYSNLVNVTSSQISNPRVSPSNAQNSYLILKLEGNQDTGSRMPLGSSPLSMTQIQSIKNWINRGARNN